MCCIYKIAVDPMEHAASLKKILKSHGNLDGFSALVQARNSIVHSEKIFKLSGVALAELWQMVTMACRSFYLLLDWLQGRMADLMEVSGLGGEKAEGLCQSRRQIGVWRCEAG